MENKITQEYICNELIAYIKNNIADSSVLVEAQTPFNQIGLDSSSVIELVLYIERRFKVSIAEKDLIPENLRSVDALAQCTHKYI